MKAGKIVKKTTQCGIPALHNSWHPCEKSKRRKSKVRLHIRLARLFSPSVRFVVVVVVVVVG
jgi:hypothetical protein